jgi:tetratricopeptide (TPR) repeat protein
MSTIADGPYPGSRAFRQADHDRFFGRAAEAADIAGLWRNERFTIVSGPVACGKTSLLQAGVYPLMTAADSDILSPGRLSYGGTFPFAALPEHNSYTLAVLRSWSPDEMATRFAGLSVGDFVRRRVSLRDGVLFAAIDQMEDLLIDSGSGPRRAWRRQFLGELARTIEDEPRLHLLLVVRDDAVATIRAAVGTGARYILKPLTRQGAIDAVTGPVAGTGRSFAGDTAENLVRDLQPGYIGAEDGERHVTTELVEPSLLQAACERLWRQLPGDATEITAHEVRVFGDADAALTAYCGQLIAEVADEHDLTAERVHTWLLDNFTSEANTRGPVYEGTFATATMPNAAVRTLVHRHLLSTGLKSGLRWYGLLSGRLIEPLRRVTGERPRSLAPADCLRAAERASSLGELDRARRLADQVLRAKPGPGICAEALGLRAGAQSLLGNIAYEQENPEEAEAWYRNAASLWEAAHDTRAAARQLAAAGKMLLAQGKASDAVHELRVAADRVPNDLAVQTELAVALWQLGEGRTAVAILTDVLGIDGGNAEALRARGEILADLGDASHAMLDLDRQSLRDRPAAQAARGLALAGLGDHSAASREIDNAIEEAPRNGPVLLYAARVSALGGDETSSEELARRAVDATDPPLSPQHREAALRLAGHKLRAGRR